jgi:hypothetical protein
MRLSSLSLALLSCVPVLALACAANTKSGFGSQSGSSGDGTGSGATGVGGGSLDVSVGAGVGGGGTSLCNAMTEICDNELKSPMPCDQGLAVSDSDPMKAAKALDICRVAGQSSDWGLVSAKYVRANGTASKAGEYTGLVPKFGKNIKPQLGSTMLALSSGKARDKSMVNPCGSESCMTTGAGKAPAGFPQDVPGCTGSKSINDDIGLEVTLRAPKNAKGYEFNFAFMSFEFAEWVCTSYNDQFIALVSPAPMGSVNGNISFDKKKNPVSVNIALFDHCDASTKSTFAEFCQLEGSPSCPAPPSPYCPNGDAFLTGTGWGISDGWGDSGSTGWLVTTAPVQGGQQFSIRFAIWDTGDEALDSLVLVDGFRWKGDPVGVGTDTVPNPK